MRGMLKILAVAISTLALTPVARAQSGPTWTQLFPASDPTLGSPLLRENPSAIYDAMNQRMVIFAGAYTSGGAFIGVLNDTWALSDATGLRGSTAWTGLVPSGIAPSSRYAHAAVYDPGTNRMIMFAGLAGCCSGELNDTWLASNANGLGGALIWTQASPAGALPPARYGPGATYDRGSNRMTLFGGADNQVAYNDVWVLANANGNGGSPTWIKLTPAAGPAPSGRTFRSVVYDPINNRMIAFGGTTSDLPNVGGDLASASNDVWVLTNANGLGSTPSWIQLNPIGPPPLPRFEHTATYDPGTNRMTIFGGETSLGCSPFCSNDVWVLTNANGLGGAPTWIQLPTPSLNGPPGPAPFPRARHVAVYDTGSNRMTIFGGTDNHGNSFNDVWVLTNANGLSEIPVSIEIKPPAAPPVPVNIGSHGVIPVAILSTRDFNATLVNPATIDLSGAKVKLKGDAGRYSCSIEDVNGDGLDDLLCHVSTSELQLRPGANMAVLTGTTTGGGGQAIRGSEAIFVAPK